VKKISLHHRSYVAGLWITCRVLYLRSMTSTEASFTVATMSKQRRQTQF